MTEIPRNDYINKLVGEIDLSYSAGGYRELAADRNTTGITFYPKTIDGIICTVLEYIGDNEKTYKIQEPSNVVGLFMPLNETKNGCDKYLVIYSINQTADWLDSVKVLKEEGNIK